MKTKKLVASILNCLIFVLVAFGTIAMILGYNFMSKPGDPIVLSATHWKAFKFFTVDSNVLAGLVALCSFVYGILQSKGKVKNQPVALKYFQLAAATGVTLTMMVTAFFLAPKGGADWMHYYLDTNFFFHLIVPLLCVVEFVCFEPMKMPFKFTPLGVIPMFIYTCCYIPHVLLHLENGKPVYDYDFYGFFGGHVNNMYFVIPLMLVITWLFSLGLWALNKKIASR